MNHIFPKGKGKSSIAKVEKADAAVEAAWDIQDRFKQRGSLIPFVFQGEKRIQCLTEFSQLLNLIITIAVYRTTGSHIGEWFVGYGGPEPRG